MTYSTPWRVLGNRCGLVGASAALARDVLAQGELDAGQRAGNHQIARPGLAVAQLDDHRLAADGVGAAVEDVGGGGAAGEAAIDVDVARVEHVFHAGHRADRDAAFVDRVVGDVRVRVDDARRDELAGRVVDVGAGGNRHVRADRGNLAVAHQHGAVGDGAARGGDDRPVADRDDGRGRSLRGKRRREIVRTGKDGHDRTEHKTARQPAANHAKPPGWCPDSGR